MVATLLGTLAAQIGLDAAKKLMTQISTGKDTKARLSDVTALVKDGATAIDAFRKVFGPEFDAALNDVFGTPTKFTFHQGQQDYIEVALPEGTTVVRTVRDELNINLERIAVLCEKNSASTRNYFLGVFHRWKERYIDLLGEDPDATETFATIDSLLDGNRRTFADALRLLQRTGLGAGGALMIVAGAMVATSTGVGVAAWLMTGMFGVPMITVASLVIPGALLIALATVNFDFTNGMTASIGAAYKLLERREQASIPPNIVEATEVNVGRLEQRAPTRGPTKQIAASSTPVLAVGKARPSAKVPKI